MISAPQVMDRRQTSQFFDGYAAAFGAIYGTRDNPLNRAVNKLFRRSMIDRFRLSLAGCQPIRGYSVYDIGCGPGHYAVELARMGASHVLGIDFAEGMLNLGRLRAEREGVAGVCRFECVDFSAWKPPEKADYVIAMGFMDYVADARLVVGKILSLARRRAFLSFPRAGGVLAWQRKLKYRRRCPLHLYTPDEVSECFCANDCRNFTVKRISRDLFVTAETA